MSDQNYEDHNDAGLNSLPDTPSRSPFNGAFPSADVLQEYEQLLPGGAKEILLVFQEQIRHRMEREKNEQEHRAKIEQKLVNSDIIRGYLGLGLGFIIAISGLGGSVYLGINDKTWASGLMGVGTLTGLVTVFVKGNERQRS
ncbi:MAG: DUF2335 domain-containing protein [Crocosphaera sp.]|jgi:uncharacterized membrane protein